MRSRLAVKSIAFFLTVSFVYDAIADSKGIIARRQNVADDSDPLYLDPAPRILPGPSTDPAPNVLPAGSIDRAAVVAPAGVIEPAPQIAPAPVILPSNAIREKNRAYPKEKRSEMQKVGKPRQALEEAIITVHQVLQNKLEANPPQAQNNKTNPRPLTSKQRTLPQKAVVSVKETESDRQPLEPKPKEMKKANNSNNDKSIVRGRKQGREKSERIFTKGLLGHHIFKKYNNTANYRILKKNGAILVPGKIYAPTPYHFKLDRKSKLTTTSPTKTSATTKANSKKNNEKKKLKKMKEGCKGASYRPSLQVTARVIPTQTSFIEKGLNPKQVNKAPMQKPFTKPTKKTAPQILAGCSMEPETIKAPEYPTKSSKVKQTLFIPKVPLLHRKMNQVGKYKTVQTMHIKQKTANGRARRLKLGSKKGNDTIRKFKAGFKKEGSKTQTKSAKPSSKNKKVNKKRFQFLAASIKTKTNGKSSRSNGLKHRNYRRRERRQLLVPYNGLANEPQINSLAQQLLSSLPAQPVLSEPQNILGQMITSQSEQPLLSQSSLLDKQTPSLYSPLLQQGLSSPFSLPQQQQQQPLQSAGLPLAPLLPAQNTLSSVPMVANPVVQNSPISYQSPLTQGFLPLVQQPRTEPADIKQTIPELTEYSIEEEYPRTGRRRHYHYHHRMPGSYRRSRMRQNPYEYESFRSFQDTYGESPGIFDDLKDISSEMERYGDEDSYRDDEGRRHRHYYGRRFHHSRHRRPLYKEYEDYDSDGRGREDESEDDIYNTHKEYASSQETDDHETNPAADAPDVNPEIHPVTNPAVGPVVDPKEESSLHDAEESTENAVKDENVRKEKVKEEKVSMELKDDSEETEETTAKRSELVKQLDKDAVMHLDFDEEGAQRKNIVKDKTDNKNDATLSNGAAVTIKSLGTCGRGIILKKGEISYNGTYFKRKPTKEVSISMWVKSKNPGFIRWFDQNDSPKKSFFTSTKSPAVTKNRWTHLVGTFDTKTGVARIYVNGKLKLEKVGKKNDGLPQDFTSTGIGRKFGDSHVTFLDDVYMFDRVISPEEVTALYKKCDFNHMILHYGFQHWNGTTHRLSDQSGLQNNATLKGGAQVRASGCDKCGACLDLQSDDAQVYLNSSKYRQKPSSAISITSWINLNRTRGLHSIFQALNRDDNNVYNLEVLNGKVHWQSKDKKGDVIFDALTNEVTIPEGLWSHVTGTYSSKTGNAKIYVNGLLRASFHNSSGPKLSTDWSRASIGGHYPDRKPFDGLLDEFFMYNWELDPSEVRFVSKYCADKPKLVSFTVKVPIL